MSSARVYLLDYPGGERQICITDSVNNVLHPAQTVPCILIEYRDGEESSVKPDYGALAPGTPVVLYRLSHLDSCQLIAGGTRQVPVVYSLQEIPFKQFDKLCRVHNEHEQRYRTAADAIRAAADKAIAEYTHRMREKEHLEIEMLGKKPSLEARLWRMLSSMAEDEG